MYKAIFASLAFVVLLSCSNTESGVSDCVVRGDSLSAESADMSICYDTLDIFDEEVLPKSADELFNDFFFNYASDEAFRRMRTSYRPAVVLNDTAKASLDAQDSLGCCRDLSVEDFYAVIYEREDELSYQKDTALANVVVERINLDKGVVECFNFVRRDGLWVMNNVETLLFADTPNSDFLSFYAQFTSDSIMAYGAVAEPLRFVLTSEDGDNEDEIQELTIEEWLNVSSDLPMPSHEFVAINYGQTFISQNNKVLLVEGVSNGLFLKYRFMKNHGKWMLVEVIV